MNILNKILLSGTLALINVLLAMGQTAKQSLNDSLLLDNSIKHGVLTNGLTYYIKPLKEPHQEINMYFLVKVGSNDELPNEINFAHHIEHLAFRETKNFPSGIKGNQPLLSDLNMHFSKLGATTNMRSTDYYFNPPARDYTKALSTGLLWFKDIASGLNLSQESIDRERGVLLQEFRSDEARAAKNIAKGELYSSLFPCYNNYYKDFPLLNSSFPYQNLQLFYKKWYQPSHMAVVVVGNIENVKKLETKIKNVFADLGSSNSKIEVPECTEKDSSNFETVSRENPTDPIESPKTMEVYLFYKDPLIVNDTNKESRLKRKLSLDIITSTLNERFKVNSKGYNKNFRNFISHTTTAEIPPHTLTIFLEAETTQGKKALESTLNIINQVKTHGITQKELEVQKEKKLSEFLPSNEDNPRYWQKEIQKHFVYGEYLPTDKNKFLRQWLEKLSIDEINEIITQIITLNPQDIGVIFPGNNSTIFKSNKPIRKFTKNELSKPVLPYNVPKLLTTLLTESQKKTLRVDKKIQSLEPDKFVLSNGLTVVLKPDTTSTERSISLHGFSPQGASCFPSEEYYSTMFAPAIIKNAGIGDFSKFDMEDFYKNTSTLKTGVAPYINYLEAGIEADVSKEELENLLQIIYLYFTQPREDKEAFNNWKADQLKYVSNFVSPTNDLLDALKDITKDLSTLPYASKRIKASQQVNLQIAYQNYRKLFSDPGRFTFILTGDFEKKEILPLLQQYLGNIPSYDNFSCFQNKEEIDLAPGPIFYEFGTSEFYNTENSFYGRSFVRERTVEDDWKEEWKVRILGMIMGNILYDFRNRDGLSLYQMGAIGKYSPTINRYEITFRYNCLPEQLPAIREKTDNIISQIKRGNISNEVFSSQRNLLKSIFNPTYLNKPENINKSLYRNYRYEEPVIDACEIETFFTELTIEDIIETANKYFQDDYLYEVKLETIK